MEEEVETHFSILAWKIPWIEKPGGLQSMDCKESDMTEATVLICSKFIQALFIIGKLVTIQMSSITIQMSI